MALLGKNLAHFLVELADRIETRQRILFQLFKIGRGDRAIFVFLFLFDFLVFEVLVGQLGFGNLIFIRIDQPVDHFVDADFVALDLVGQIENLFDRRRTGRDRVNHVFQAVFDALGDFDFTFARQ